MDAKELVRRIRKLGRAQGVRVQVVRNIPKGGHVTILFGARRAQIAMHGKGRQIPTGTLSAILKDLGLTSRDI